MMEIANTMLSSELQVFLNYVYEYPQIRNYAPNMIQKRK